MKKLVLIAFVAFFGFAANAQAKFEFKSETIDYGEIAKGSDGVRVFEFTNTGDAPLIITNVLSTCGCTVPTKPNAPILPGKKGKIEVKYNMASGPIRKTITVESNATNYEGGRIALKIKGEVIE